LQHQARISRDVQQELMRVRAVPFANLNERLYRITRQTARELGKKADLEISGSEVELDRSVLDRIGAPLEHMLRNALVHGIEDPAARVAAGKAETGRISITLHQESNEIALVFADDGAGLNLDALRKKGAQMGLLPVDREPTEGEIAHLIFASGLSTAEKLTELAGRGVGMDVVKNDITAIGGRVDITTKRGGGTTFTVYLPLTLAVTQAVLVRSGEEHHRARIGDGGAGAAHEGRSPGRTLREPQGRVPGPYLSAAIDAFPARHAGQPASAAV
jgi:chemosensory pili system protein ChpA (sensor histidine kinase/response regulator)